MVLNLDLFCRRSFSAVLFVLLAGIIVYANTFQVPFILDDHLWITQNEFIKSLDKFFTNYSVSNARFVGLLTLALNFHFGGLDVTGYHVVNLIIHLLTALLVYALLRLTFRTPYFRVQVEGSGLKPRTAIHELRCFIPLFAALLFVVHPVQTQAVTYIVQRMTTLAALFYLLSLVLYVQARLRMEENLEFRVQNSKGETRSSFIPCLSPDVLFFYAGSVLSAVLAMKTKEVAFTLPLACVLYELSFFQGPWKRRLLSLLPLLATLPIVPMSVLATGESAVVSTGGTFADLGEQLRASTGMSRLDYLFTQFRVIVTYLRLLVLPVNQNLDYDYPVFHSFFTPSVYLSFLLLTSIFFLAVWLCFCKSRIKNQKSKIDGAAPVFRLISFGIFWFFLTISVESSLIPIVDVIVEHRLYLPSVGAATAFSAAFLLLSEKFLRRRAGFTFLVSMIIIISLSVATYQRNKVWGSAVGLWEDVVSKSPQKPRSLNNLGQVLNEAGRPWEAIPVLSRALNLALNYDKANFNLARSYMLIGQWGAAIPLLRKAIEINPDFYGAYSDLGAALIKEKRYSEAIMLLERSLNFLGDMPEVHFNLGVAYLNTGNPGKARRELEILSRLDHSLASKLADLLP